MGRKHCRSVVNQRCLYKHAQGAEILLPSEYNVNLYSRITKTRTRPIWFVIETSRVVIFRGRPPLYPDAKVGGLDKTFKENRKQHNLQLCAFMAFIVK